MKVGIYLNERLNDDKERYLSVIYSQLKPAGITCMVVDGNKIIEELDLLLVLGGDGTILSVASECARCGVKILGVNLGHMGFLADFESSQLDLALSLILSGKYTVEKRTMLKIEFQDKVYYALNEVVIQRSTSGNSFSNTVNLQAKIDGSTVDNFSSDGLIISTPTGSTAYSLSAGGSILTPDLQAFIMTPICAHSLHSRPIVFSNNSQVVVNQVEKNYSLNLIIDGKVEATFSDNQKIVVSKAERFLEFISVANVNFFDKLLIKLSIWSK